MFTVINTITVSYFFLIYHYVFKNVNTCYSETRKY
jgi:hypothetical protein